MSYFVQARKLLSLMRSRICPLRVLPMNASAMATANTHSGGSHSLSAAATKGAP